ncbi:hypothetical protein HOLleu_36756 [Holothuria leucospilota]|uniref:Reverse transcriptase domain-containing protein n=1 Tax=Holothuria leucospilota TaxID=206669 RepID=A0A9Q0YMM3_HOLLE|nr:hypothetical protein HOLleu_36756 [Holothuria leucospilota]
MFDDIANDCVSHKSLYNDALICLVGDFNARTGTICDFLDSEETSLDGFDFVPLCNEVNSRDELDLLDICTLRYNQDECINNNGRKLIELCKNLDLHIVNGRIGENKGIGARTCDAKSAIDYAVASAELLPYLTNFIVDPFDRFLSDKHAPIILEIQGIERSKVDNLTSKGDTMATADSEEEGNKVINWNDTKKNDFLAALNVNDMERISLAIDSNDSSQRRIDGIPDMFHNLFFDAAEKTEMIKRRKPCYFANRTNKPWFTVKCKEMKSRYVKAKNLHKSINNALSEENLKKLSRDYKKVMKIAKRDYFNKVHKEIRSIKISDPKQYWKVINGASPKTIVQGISMEDFKLFFEDLCRCDRIAQTLPDNYLLSSNDFLNKDICIEEVTEQVRKLRNSKAPGIDGLINEFLKYSPTLVLENLTKFFNLVLSTSKVPTDWTIGLIQPIYKGKGSPKDVDNYRGITLLSSIGKLFTSILNDRIMNYMQVTGFLGDEQAGFRKGHSTLDHIFVLHTVIDLYLREKKRIFFLRFH